MSIETGLILTILAIFPFLNAGESNVADLVISFAPLVLWLIMRLNRKIVKTPPSSLELSFLGFVVLFFIFGLVSTIRSISVIESVFKLNQELALFMLVLISLPILANRRFLSQLATVLIGVATILSLISIYFLLPIAKLWTADISFFYVTYGHNHLADYLLLIIPLALTKAFSAGRQRRFYRLSLLIILSAFFLTFSRLAWMAIALLPVVFYLINPLFFKRQVALKGFLLKISMALFAVILILVPVWVNSSIKGAVQRPYLIGLLSKPVYILPRLAFISHAIKQFGSAPWFGFGQGTFQYISQTRLVDIEGTIYAHNLPLQLLYETGLFGLATYISGLSFFIFLALKSVRKSGPLETAALAGLFLSLIHAQLDFDWQISAVRLTAWFLLLAAIAPAFTLQKSLPVWFFRRVFILFCLLPVFFTIFILVNPLFNRQAYKRQIETADRKLDSATSQKLLDLWSRLDRANGEMFFWRAQRQIRLGNLSQASSDFRRAYFAPLRPKISPSQANVFLDDYLSASPTISSAEMVAVLEVISLAYTPHDFFWYKPPEYQEKIYQAINNISTPIDDRYGNDATRGLVNYWRYLVALLSDKQQFDQYQDFIDRAERADPGQREYGRISSTNRLLSNKDIDPKELGKSIEELKMIPIDERKDLYQYLLSYLYSSLADYYQKSNQVDREGVARQLAVNAMPSLGSSYLKLARYYQGHQQTDEAEKTLVGCQINVSPDCRLWFAGFL